MRAIFVITCLSLFAGVTMAADEPSTQDKQFLKHAASGDMLEIRLGQYASQNAGSDEVKKFGEHRVGDHTKAKEQMLSLTTQQPLEIPKALSDEDQQTLDRLERLKGAEFDKAYIATMIEDHQNDIGQFEKEVSEGSDTIVKAFAERTLPLLKHHLEMAQELSKSVSG
jgi:putative membrane protein